MSKVFTSKAYLDAISETFDHEDGEQRRMQLHRRYYAQFVTPQVKALVLRYIGKERLLKSTDPHFNDIPLKVWDAMHTPKWPFPIKAKMDAAGDWITMAGATCILKEAARQIVEDDRAKEQE